MGVGSFSSHEDDYIVSKTRHDEMRERYGRERERGMWCGKDGKK